MAIERQLTVEARKARPEASVRFERDGQILTMFWDWEYKGQRLSYSRAELRQDYEKDPEMVGAVVDFCVIQMGVLEKGIDDAALR
ncbi:hypothetical protein FFB58_00720 [Enterobacter sp. MF024]|uniref:hypothetical protein n=1 Tax=Enterobacter sp. MF024 TaxID=2555644 RepID=UPI001105B6A4|nr:hypothetical protein [Enterobacter sp. MF024]TLU69580.1 hypothetical protein FFB58_00720 [Enterobacter sp. MF024]